MDPKPVLYYPKDRPSLQELVARDLPGGDRRNKRPRVITVAPSAPAGGAGGTIDALAADDAAVGAATSGGPRGTCRRHACVSTTLL